MTAQRLPLGPITPPTHHYTLPTVHELTPAERDQQHQRVTASLGPTQHCESPHTLPDDWKATA